MWLKKTILIIAVAVTVGCLGYIFSLPNVSLLKNINPKETAFMRIKPHEISQQWVPLRGISPYLAHAVIVAEDGNFYSHNGLDYEELREAFHRNIEKGRLAYGASTITQQLARNLYLSPSKNPLRKLKEALIARQLEAHLTKNRILELYLNVVEWGPGIYGCQAASQYYFGKTANELSPEEAARLASYLPSPIRYGRLRNSRYLARRTKTILIRMQARGYLI